MSSKYAKAPDALRALCQQHRVSMSPSRYGTIGVFDATEGTADTVIGIEDRTGGLGIAPAARQPVELPARFATQAEAEAFPG